MFRSVSCRVVAASWWLFVLLIVSSYTANLAASFTVGSIDNSINNAEDLVSQTQVKFGTSSKYWFQLLQVNI